MTSPRFAVLALDRGRVSFNYAGGMCGVPSVFGDFEFGEGGEVVSGVEADGSHGDEGGKYGDNAGGEHPGCGGSVSVTGGEKADGQINQQEGGQCDDGCQQVGGECFGDNDGQAVEAKQHPGRRTAGQDRQHQRQTHH